MKVFDPITFPAGETKKMKSVIHAPAPEYRPVTSFSREEKMRRATAYAATMDPAIEGSNGDARTYRAVCSVGHDFDLSTADTLEALHGWNARCQPAWREEELRTKIENAMEYATEPRGWRLTVAPPNRIAGGTFMHVSDQAEDHSEPDSIQETVKPPAPAYQIITPPESFVTRYVQYASQRTDAPSEAHELMAVGLLSALAGPNPRIPIATNIEGWPLSIWTLYVVNSTVGRKTSLINFALDIATEVLGREAILFWEGSPQGIIQRLQQRDGLPAIFARDEYSGLLGQMNKSGGHMAGLAQTFIRAYDGGTLENIRTRKKNKQTGEYEDDTDCVRRPYLVKLCASTWDSLVTRATIDNVLDGFLARFAVFTGSSEPRPMKRATPELQTLRLSLIDHARRFHERARLLETLDVEDAVLELAWTLEREWLQKAEECGRPDAAGPALKRLSETVLKVAGLMAIDDAVPGEVPVVRAGHFEAARGLGNRWIESTLKLIDALGRTGFQQQCEAVLASVRNRAEGIRMRDLYRMHRKLNSREFNSILEALQTQDEIKISEVDSKKGPAFRWIVATRRES